VFEVIRLYGGRPFALEEHLQRLARSAMNLRLALDEPAVRAEIAALLQEAGPVDAALRVVVTRGGRRIAIVEPIKPMPDTLALATVTYAPTRILDAVKSLSYAGNMLASRLARESGADEALLVTPHGRVLEAPTAAFFYSLDGKHLHVPPLEDHILDSITRRRVIALMGATDRVTSTDDLRDVGEAFLASTTREVHPVHAIDGRDLPGEGALTAAAARAVRERIVSELLAE
jgi:branched-chain amino acid aminotransferase